MNLPNKLTLARVILTPLYLLVMLLQFDMHYLVALVIFSVAASTDFLDGKIARKHNLVTTFGKLVDPVADKMLTTAAMLAFMQLGLCNIWVVMIVITREFLVTSFRLVACAQGVVIAAGIWGKLKTVSQMVFSILIMILAQFYEYFMKWSTLCTLSNILMWITALLTVISGVKYIVDGIKVVDFSK